MNDSLWLASQKKSARGPWVGPHWVRSSRNVRPISNPEVASPCSEQPAARPYPQLVHNYVANLNYLGPISIISLSFKHRSSTWFLSFRIPGYNFAWLSLASHARCITGPFYIHADLITEMVFGEVCNYEAPQHAAFSILLSLSPLGPNVLLSNMLQTVSSSHTISKLPFCKF
jgi:hypothetical protein